MANTYTLIASATGNGSSGSVTFSSIPATYTDLKVVMSSRDSDTTSTANNTNIQFNGDTGSNYNSRTLVDLVGTVYSFSNTDTAISYLNHNSAGSSSTANTFDNTEIYIPNYLSSNQKSVSIDCVVENNSTLGYLWLTAGIWTGTSAITSIKISTGTGNYVTGSTFYLYGIKNS